MARTRSNPFRGFVDMITELERARRVGMTGHEVPAPGRGRGEADSWAPPADIYVVGDDLVIRLEVPGVRAGGLDVTLTDGLLTVYGERGSAPPADAVYTLECRHGPFRRTMILPPETAQEQVAAVLSDGVVEITVAGAGAAAGPERIPVSDRARPQVLRGHRG